MGAESVKTSGLPRVNAAYGSDRLVLLSFANGSGAGDTSTVPVSGFLGNVQANVFVGNTYSMSANTLIVRNRQTPANSTSMVVSQGTVFWDSSFIYVATSNNHVKRAVLSDF